MKKNQKKPFILINYLLQLMVIVWIKGSMVLCLIPTPGTKEEKEDSLIHTMRSMIREGMGFDVPENLNLTGKILFFLLNQFTGIMTIMSCVIILSSVLGLRILGYSILIVYTILIPVILTISKVTSLVITKKSQIQTTV